MCSFAVISLYNLTTSSFYKEEVKFALPASQFTCLSIASLLLEFFFATPHKWNQIMFYHRGRWQPSKRAWAAKVVDGAWLCAWFYTFNNWIGFELWLSNLRLEVMHDWHSKGVFQTMKSRHQQGARGWRGSFEEVGIRRKFVETSLWFH